MPISRETARKRTTWAQVGAGILLAGAAATWAISLPPPRMEEPGTPTGIEPPVEAKPQPAPALDTLGLASTLDASGIIRVEPEAKPEDKPTEVAGAGTPAATPAAQPGDWKYLGSIVGPQSTHAMVSIDGKQKLLTPGAEVGGIKIVEVAADELTVEEKGARRHIKLAPKTSAWPSGAAARTARPNIAGTPTPPPPVPNPDMEAERLERERMLMEQQEAARAKQGGAGAGAAPMRPSPLPTDAATGRPVPVKGLGGAGSRH